MAGINKVIIVGRLGNDPEYSIVGSGVQLCKMSVATSETWIDKSGQKQERTEWHRIQVWGKAAENCGKYLKKGRQVYIEGKLQTRSWEHEGQKKYATDIVANTIQFLGDVNRATSGQGNPANHSTDHSFQDFGPEPTFNTNEDIPF